MPVTVEEHIARRIEPILDSLSELYQQVVLSPDPNPYLHSMLLIRSYAAIEFGIKTLANELLQKMSKHNLSEFADNYAYWREKTAIGELLNRKVVTSGSIFHSEFKNLMNAKQPKLLNMKHDYNQMGPDSIRQIYKGLALNESKLWEHEGTIAILIQLRNTLAHEIQPLQTYSFAELAKYKSCAEEMLIDLWIQVSEKIIKKTYLLSPP